MCFLWKCVEKILPNKRQCSGWAHPESAVNTPFVAEQMTESVHTTSLWPSWNGKSRKLLFIHKLVQMYPDVSGKTLFIHKVIHAYPGVCITCILHKSPWYNRTGWLGVKHQVTYYTSIYIYIHTDAVIHPSTTEGKTDSDNLFCFTPHSCFRELAHSRCVSRFNIDINW